MPPKLQRKPKKAGKKKKKKVAPVKVKKSEYEEQITELNRELAAEWQKTFEVETLKIKADEALDSQHQDLDDVKQFLGYEIECEENEISGLEEDIQWLTNKKENQRQHYRPIIQQMQEDKDKILEPQESSIKDNKITLIILNHFSNQRQEYLDQQSQITEEEKRQRESHKDQLYEEDKKLRMEEVPEKQEMFKQLNELFSPLKQRISKQGKEERKVQIKQENKKLERNIFELSGEYLSMGEKYEQVMKKEQEVKLELNLLQQRLTMVVLGRQKRKSSVKEPKTAGRLLDFGRSNDLKPEFEETVEQIREVDENEKCSENKSCHKLMKFLEEIELMVVEEMAQEEEDVQSVNSHLQPDPEEQEEEKDRLFEERQKMIDGLAEKIDKFLKKNLSSAQPVSERELTISPQARSKERPISKLTTLQRYELYRNLHEPKNVNLKKLKKEVFLPLAAVSDCHQNCNQ